MKVEYLVVDTSAFIRNAQLQDLAENIITLDDVVNEIKSYRQLRHLIVLPYDLAIKDVFSENIKIVSDFSKKTGDYPSLSSIDLKVIALTYQLEKELVGVDHIRTDPIHSKSFECYNKSNAPSAEKVAGFYTPNTENSSNIEDDINLHLNELHDVENSHAEEQDIQNLIEKLGETYNSEIDEEVEGSQEGGNEEVWNKENDLVDRLEGLTCLEKVADDEREEVSDSDSIFDDDECGWITLDNLAESKRGAGQGLVSDRPVTVACLTTDFAMQNVLKQMGLNILSLDGVVINEIRTYILRCHACFKTTSVMDKVFCPKCGLKTLKKVAVSVDDDGKQQIFINYKRRITAKGKRFPIPRPKGGKHSIDPIIVEDQRVPQQRLSKKALQKTNALHPDYTTGFSPFVMKDTTSRSIMLGFHTRATLKHMPPVTSKKRKSK